MVTGETEETWIPVRIQWSLQKTRTAREGGQERTWERTFKAGSNPLKLKKEKCARRKSNRFCSRIVEPGKIKPNYKEKLPRKEGVGLRTLAVSYVGKRGISWEKVSNCDCSWGKKKKAAPTDCLGNSQ